MIYLLFVIALLLGAFFSVRYFSIKHALREVDRDLQEIQKDIRQNRILHLPLPDRNMEGFMKSINGVLSEISRERQRYMENERQFQKQIENISHDLRTPLTVILGYLKYIRKQPNSEGMTEEQKDTLEIIERKAKSMERLVAQFYMYSRLNAQEYKLAIQEIDACRILRETLMDHYQLLEQVPLKVCADLPEHPVLVLGETDSLERIFLNLFQNAVRYAESFLNIFITSEKDKAIISFENDTEKITEEDVPHLFERFYMQDDSRHQGGTGLGLTVAKSLAEAMDGTLEARMVSNEHSGESKKVIRFVLTLKI